MSAFESFVREAVFKLSRLRIADNEPLMVEDTYLPVKFFLSLTDQLLRSKPLYDLFSEDFKQTVRLADEELYASIASKEDAKLLMIPEGAPVLHLARQTYNMKNEIIEFTLSVARADQFHYQIRHIRNRRVKYVYSRKEELEQLGAEITTREIRQQPELWQETVTLYHENQTALENF